MTCDPSLGDKVVVVAGGSRGIGASISSLLVGSGARVVIASRGERAGQSLAAKLGPQAHFHAMDVARETCWEALTAEVVRVHGRIDALINAAGLTPVAAIDSITESEIDAALAVNVKGLLFGIKHVGRAMKQAHRGAMVIIGSLDSLRGVNGMGSYVASKWAARGLIKTAALEYGPQGIRINILHPGAVATERNAICDPSHPEYAAIYGSLPLQRVGKPDEIAAAAAFLCSDAASYISGAEISVDGGWSAGVYYSQLPGAPGH